MQDKNTFYKVCRVIFKPILFLITRYKLINKYNLNEKGRVIVVSNHISALDPICIAVGQKRPIRFIAKKELFENKFVSWFLRKLGAFPVDREANDIHAIKEFMRGLKNEEAMGIFIEGTRSKTGNFLEPKEGPAMFSMRCNANVLPVCITKIGKRRYVHFGEMITYDELRFSDDTLSKNEKLEFATNYIFDKIKELRKTDLKNEI